MVHKRNQKDDTFERAKELYENVIKHELTDDQLGMYLAIEVETGDYEIGESRLDTGLVLRKRHPTGQIFGMLHGSYTVGSIGYAPPTPGSITFEEYKPT